MEPSIPFHTAVFLVDAEDFTNEEAQTLDLPLEINNVTSKLEFQNLSAEFYDANLEVMFSQTTDPNNRNKPAFRKYCKYCHKSNQSFSICFCKEREDERKQISYFRSKSLAKFFNQWFRAYQNQIHSIEHHSSYPVNYFSRKSFDSRYRSNSRN